MRDEYDFSKGVRGKYAGKVDTKRIHVTSRARVWRNPSVRLLAGDRDPIDVIREKARAIVLEALDKHGLSYPIDPVKLAALRSIKVLPSPEVREAQTVSDLDKKPVIEYNPNRSSARIRFSICHELAHTLFPDCVEQTRYRGYHADLKETDRELEMLCNVAAAEFLLPVGGIQDDLRKYDLTIDTALRLRQKYEASVEAVLLRLVGLSSGQCAVFAALPEASEGAKTRYRLEYVKSTPSWDPMIKRGDLLPENTVALECTSIGTTAKASREQWIPDGDLLRVEMVGTTAYPSEKVLPRVLGLIRPADSAEATATACYELLRGDALDPRGEGPKIVAHVVNDQTPNWGAGFGRAVQTKWPNAQRHFRSVMEEKRGSKLGLTALSRVEDDLYTFQMVCQRGYGPSPTPRLRYEALRQCLVQLYDTASQQHASVHMPKIGSGEAGGSWGLVSNLIAEELCAKGVSVTVYELPNQKTTQRKQSGLFDDRQ